MTEKTRKQTKATKYTHNIMKEDEKSKIRLIAAEMDTLEDNIESLLEAMDRMEEELRKAHRDLSIAEEYIARYEDALQWHTYVRGRSL